MTEQRQPELLIRAMTPTDAASVAELHVSQISEGFLSSLGPRVLASIYQALPRTSVGFGFIADRGGQVIGFVTCATQLNRLYRGILCRKGLVLSWRLIRHFLRLRTLQKMVQTIFYPGKVRLLQVPDAEVLSVVTAPAARGLGVASRLMACAFAEFKRRGCPQVKVLVGADLGPANAYYLKNGFTLVGTISHHDRPENIYVADLSGCSPSDKT